VPPDGKRMEDVRVLHSVRYGGRYCTIGRTFELVFNIVDSNDFARA
jgi:hypothetical protein